MLTWLISDDLPSLHGDQSQAMKIPVLTAEYPSSSTFSASSTPEQSLPPGIIELIKPHIISATAQTFRSRSGKIYQLPMAPRVVQPLRNQVLILDVESRDIGGPGGLLDNGKPTTDDLQGLTLGRLNHYMFGENADGP